MAKVKTQHYYEGVGRRKSAIALVRLYVTGKDKTAQVEGEKLKAGDVRINKEDVKSFFPLIVDKVRYLQPLKLTGNEGRFVISAHISGGGVNGQLEAFVHGLSRALEKVDSELRPILKKEQLLTRDARVRERRKVGTGGKARRAKQSPKR